MWIAGSVNTEMDRCRSLTAIFKLAHPHNNRVVHGCRSRVAGSSTLGHCESVTALLRSRSPDPSARPLLLLPCRRVALPRSSRQSSQGVERPLRAPANPRGTQFRTSFLKEAYGPGWLYWDAGAHLLHPLGYVNSFGVYETYYLKTFLSGHSPSDVAWIGAIQSFAQFSAALIAGPLADRYGAMIIIWPFSILLVVAMMLTSLCTELYQFVLCQGIFIGIASGLIFTPAISIVGHYFSKRRPMAMAFATTGSPLGGIIYPVIMTNLLQDSSVGFAWGQRVCGFLTLFLLAIAAVTIRPTSLKRNGPFILPEAFKIPAFSLQVAAFFMVILGLWTPYFYLADYGTVHGMSPGLASYLFALINAGSFLGRVFAGSVARHLGQFNVITVACYAAGILMFCWLKITSTAGLIVLSILFGAASGIIIALMYTTIAHTADHPSKIGTYIGMSTFLIGFGALGGTPITGALIDTYGGYSQGIIFSGAVLMTGAVLFTAARLSFAKGKLVV